MSQKLILPINDALLTASWKTVAYSNKYGFAHYGIDLISRTGAATGVRKVYASGDGVVVAAGYDSVVGNVVAVRYKDALHHPTGKSCDLILRYFHLERISVKSGAQVNKDTVLGSYGNTGSLVMGKHLHLEADTDTAHPLYTPTVVSSSLLQGRSRGATDSTMRNPVEYLHCKQDSPDKQSWQTSADQFVRAEDKAIPTLS